MNPANMLGHPNLVDLTMDLLLCSQARTNRWKSTRYRSVATRGDSGAAPTQMIQTWKTHKFCKCSFSICLISTPAG